MEEFINRLLVMNEPKTLFILCGVFIFTDVLTGYLKAFKTKKINSSISRDGYLKKISWLIALLLGFVVDFFGILCSFAFLLYQISDVIASVWRKNIVQKIEALRFRLAELFSRCARMNSR